jgi:hypothetical protein
MPSARSLNRTSREGGTSEDKRSPIRSKEAAEIEVVQRQSLADKIIGGTVRKNGWSRQDATGASR